MILSSFNAVVNTNLKISFLWVLFNTLNNLYILTKTKPELAAESILNLSDLIRYQLQTISKESVPIQDEIDYMKNLLHLEQIRRDDLKIIYNLEIEDSNFQIQPMILSPLIENAIKHGSQKLNKCLIEISLKVQKDYFNFEIINSIPNLVSNTFEEGSGLTNLRRRLEICYPERYSINFENKSDSFSAILILR